MLRSLDVMNHQHLNNSIFRLFIHVRYIYIFVMPIPGINAYMSLTIGFDATMEELFAVCR